MNRTVLFTVVAVSMVSFLSGCSTVSWGNWTSIHRKIKPLSGNGSLIDIKQRAIIVGERKDVGNGNPGKSQNAQIVICAEPSPDSLSSYAAELVAKADTPTVSAQLAAGFQEGAAFTGLRTQSIQILRDSMYRTCEAYMNGAIDEDQYALLARRYQKQTVALLAIEQLTGTVRVPPITISSTTSAEAARSLAVIRKEIADTDERIKDLEKKNSDLNSNKKDQKSVTSQNDKDKIASENSEIDNEINNNKKKITEYQNDKIALEKGIESAGKILASGSATAKVSPVDAPIKPGNEQITSIAGVVNEIVQLVSGTDDAGQLCILHLQKNPTSRDNVSNFCNKYLDAKIKEIQKNINSNQVQNGGIWPDTTRTPASQAPASQAPASQAPASQTPAPQAPASQTPAPQAPASQTPAPETPPSKKQGPIAPLFD